LIGCEKYREIFKPFHKRLWNYVHDHSDCKVTLHSCGAVSDFIPDLLDAGLDILNPVQTTATGMDPAWLKREYGKDLVFWGGGCDTQRVLSFGTPREVQDDVRKRVKILGRDGGLVFAQIHNIQADVPPENIVAMLTAVSESGSK
jgi:uroporphyrinogen decarboxylase